MNTVSPANILVALNNAVTAINNLAAQIGTAFPQTTASSTTAPTAGTITFSSSQPEVFLVVQTSSGALVKIPGYTV